MKTIFFGGSLLVIPIINVLKANFGLEYVVVKNENDPLINYCNLNNIDFEINSNLKYAKKNPWEKNTQIFSKKADVGIVADYGVYIPKEVSSFYPKGILNIHPSLLPKYRGPTPVQSAILSSETKTGVTIIKIDSQIDHGPILAQKEYEIEKTETSFDLLKKLFNQAASLLEDTLPKYLSGNLIPKPQDDSKATFTRIFVKNDGLVDLENLPNIEKLDNMIRAFYPWPGVWTKTNVGKQNEKIVKFLPGNLIQVEGKKEMSYKDFLNGYLDANPKLRVFLEQYA